VEVATPRFAGDGRSFMAVQKPRHILRVFKFNLSFRPRDLRDGLLVYCAQNPEGGPGDFASLAIKDKRLEFRFDTGSGPAIIRGRSDLRVGRWYTATVARRLKEATMTVDDEEPVSGQSPGTTRGLNIKTHIYVGGVDRDVVTVSPGAGVDADFAGCLADLAVGRSNQDMTTASGLRKAVVDASNVDECSEGEEEEEGSQALAEVSEESLPLVSCGEFNCLNGGVCGEGRTCLCPWGFIGKTCQEGE